MIHIPGSSARTPRSVSRQHRPSAAIALGVVTLLSGLPAMAQGPADPLALPGLIVTATQSPQNADRLPTPVSVLTRTSLEERGIHTVADALRAVPGLAIVRQASAGSLTSIFMRGGESDYVKVLVDGVPVNEVGGAIDLADLSTAQIERIEVVRGPTSVVFGSDAVSGVVQIFTVRGQAGPRLEVQALGGRGERRYGSGGHGVLDAEATLSGSTSSLDYAFGGSHSWSGGTYELNNQSRLSTLSAGLGWADGAGTSVRLTSRLTDSEFHFPTDFSGAPADDNQAQERLALTSSLMARRALGERLRLQVALGVSRWELAVRDAIDGPADTLGTFSSSSDSEVRRATADLRLTADLGGTVVTLGGSHDAFSGALDAVSESEFGPLAAAVDYDRSTTAAYAELLAEPAPGVHTTLGARADHSDTFGGFGTYRLGLAWSAWESTRIRGALGRAFREPNYWENFGSGYGDVGNADLLPERTRSWEVGLEQRVGPALLSLTWFDQNFQDLIQYVTPGVPGDPNYMNVGNARSPGLEVGAEGGVGDTTFTLSYTYLERPLLRRPRHSGSIGATYRHARGVVGLWTNLVGERDDFGGAPARYATVDLSAEMETSLVPGYDTQLLLRVENLLDADYEAAAGFPAPGRIIRIGARVGLGE